MTVADDPKEVRMFRRSNPIKFRIVHTQTGEIIAESETREGIESALIHVDGPESGNSHDILEGDIRLGTLYRDGGINWTWEGRERGWR